MSEEGTDGFIGGLKIAAQTKRNFLKLGNVDTADVWERNSWCFKCQVRRKWDIFTVTVHTLLHKEAKWGRTLTRSKLRLKKNHCRDSKTSSSKKHKMHKCVWMRIYETTHLICTPQQHEWEVSSRCPLCTVDWSGSRWSTKCWEIKYGGSLERSTVGKHIIGNRD